MANPKESELNYPLGAAKPALGEVLEVAPGVRWLRMGLPFALDHINLWLLRDELDGRQGWAVVDCGVTNEATQGAWEQVFASGLDGLPVLRVIVTHFHPDHMGLAHWLTARWSTPESECRLWMSATDYNVARMASNSTIGMGGESAARFFGSHGLTDPDALDKIRARSSYYPNMVPAVPPRFKRLMNGQLLRIGGRDWRCIVGYGHAPEHMALYCEDIDGAPEAPAVPTPQGGALGLEAAQRPRGLLISGDMVLPRISTNVSVVDVEPEADPLALYLGSIIELNKLPADTLILPSHGLPFTGLHQRIRQLQEHHDERLAEVFDACSSKACCAAELLDLLFKRKLDLHQTTFAMGESVAHLHTLWFQGKLNREVGVDGIIRFSKR